MNSQASEKVYSTSRKEKQQPPQFAEFGPYYQHTASTIRSAFAANQRKGHPRNPGYRGYHEQDQSYQGYGAYPPPSYQQFSSAHHIKRDTRDPRDLRGPPPDPRFVYPHDGYGREQGRSDYRFRSDKHINHARENFARERGHNSRRDSAMDPSLHAGYDPRDPRGDPRGYPPQQGGNFRGSYHQKIGNMPPGHYNRHYQQPPYGYSNDPRSRDNFYPQQGPGQFYPPQSYPEFRSERRVMHPGRFPHRDDGRGNFYPQRDMKGFNSDMNIGRDPHRKGQEAYAYNYPNEHQNEFSRGYGERGSLRDVYGREKEPFMINEFMQGEEEEEDDNGLQRADVPF